MGLDFSRWLETTHQLEAYVLFYEYHLRLPRTAFFKFEDYKLDPIAHLKNILNFVCIQATDEEIERAVFNSSLEKTQEGERLYRNITPEEKRPHGEKIRNLAGATKQWRNEPESFSAFKHIEEKSAGLMKFLATNVNSSNFD